MFVLVRWMKRRKARLQWWTQSTARETKIKCKTQTNKNEKGRVMWLNHLCFFFFFFEHCGKSIQNSQFLCQIFYQNFFVRTGRVWKTRWMLTCRAVEFFYNSLFSAISWQNPASIDGEEQNKKLPPVVIWIHNLRIMTLMLWQLSKVYIQLPAWIIMAFIKSCSIDSRNNQSPTCELVHETKLTSEISCSTETCLAQSVER